MCISIYIGSFVGWLISMEQAKQNRTDRTGQTEQDCQCRTVRTVLLGQGSKSIKAEGQESWDRTVGTGQRGKDRVSRKG
jgi:hypothetical protein